MSIPFISKVAAAGVINTPRLNLSRYPNLAGTISAVAVTVDSPAAGDMIFNLRIDGEAQFSGAGRPKILAGETSTGVIDGLSIVVTDLQVISWDLEAISGVCSGPSFVVAFDGDGSISDLEGLTDVDLTTPAVGDMLIYNGSEWINKVIRESIAIPCSDQTTAITAGTAKVTFRMPYAFTLSEVRASVNTAPTGSTIIIDVNENGSTILSTKVSIDASEETSETGASASVISDASLADDAEITIDFDQVGSSVAGKGVIVYLIGRQT